MKTLYSLLVLFAAACASGACSPQMSSNLQRQTEPAAHPDYAVVYLYRPSSYVATPYDVYIGTEKVYRSRKFTKQAVKLYKPGQYEIWAETETKEVMPLDVELGKDYYVRTGTTFGEEIWRPAFTIVSAADGKGEWNAIRE